jgi:hypothetical protein
MCFEWRFLWDEWERSRSWRIMAIKENTEGSLRVRSV